MCHENAGIVHLYLNRKKYHRFVSVNLVIDWEIEKTWCFKNVTSLPIKYDNNSKALFGKWLAKLDAKFMKESKKVIRFIIILLIMSIAVI